MSEICESFGCTPDQAMAQDWELVSTVLDYRTAKAAVDVFGSTNRAASFDTLKKHPELALALSRMNRAQLGGALDEATVDEGAEVVRAHMTDEPA